MQTVDADLQHLLNHVVDNEEAEYHLTQTHKVVPAAHISYQTNCLELPGGHDPASSRELHQQPDQYIRQRSGQDGSASVDNFK